MAARALGAIAVLLATTGCVVAPPYAPVYGEPAPVYGEAPVYSASPTYVSPGVGFIWLRHPRYGYGWHHPHRGWHRGWHGGGYRGWR